MCCVVEPEATLTNTIIYAGAARRPDGERVHVLSYQNTLSSSRYGANAMLLPIPTSDLLGPENVVDSRPFRSILKNYEKSVQEMKPKTNRRSANMLTKGGGAASLRSDFQTFRAGSYHVASATSLPGLKQAVQAVPERARPDLPFQFLAALGKMYPGWSFLACCFCGEDVLDGVEAEPVTLWYRPMAGREDTLFAPAVDAHDGKPPVLSASVWRDHTLAFGDVDAEGVREAPYMREHVKRLPEEHRWMFSHAVVGSVVKERTTRNGDFVMPTSRVKTSVAGYVGADEVRVDVPQA